jgi:hypothetical protein
LDTGVRTEEFGFAIKGLKKEVGDGFGFLSFDQIRVVIGHGLVNIVDELLNGPVTHKRFRKFVLYAFSIGSVTLRTMLSVKLFTVLVNRVAPNLGTEAQSKKKKEANSPKTHKNQNKTFFVNSNAQWLPGNQFLGGV